MKLGQTLNVVASGVGVGKSIFWSERMNERIRELCIQSGAYEHYEVNEGVNGDELPMQRFAELILQECARIALSDEVAHMNPQMTAEKIHNAILKMVK
jgi:hypothetical protein